MSTVNPWALGVFVVFFAATIVIGSSIQWIRKLFSRGQAAQGGEDWSLGGRQFGPWVTWFLVGGDFYTAYTVIAVPALVYAVGGYGFFALPYTIIVYPFIFLVMPKLWRIAQKGGHTTAADIVRARFNSRPLEIIVAITGLVAVMPYIALQLIGIRTVIQALGLPGDIPLIIAFLSLAAYTWLGGLHAPALTAFIFRPFFRHGSAASALPPLRLAHLFQPPLWLLGPQIWSLTTYCQQNSALYKTAA
ncbi:hypothetical protein AA0482_1395 [Acetobacter cibinongensis NRIC 0482]|nr:hypothetical protein AA0482_1395 [Acetobacter cibinongensis NRIC 0482]